MPPRSQIDNEITLFLALSLVPGMGNRRIHQLLATLKHGGYALADVTEMPHDQAYRHIPGLAVQFEGVLKSLVPAKLKEAEVCIRRARKMSLEIIHIADPAYPGFLKDYLGMDAPPVLFLSGALNLLEEESCAVVGTRAPSDAGERAAREASEMIVGAGMVLASGGALGVDSAAHDAALRAGGATLLFLPQGIGTYPLPLSWGAARESGRLLLASEYLPSAPWRTYAAVSRNALIAAQSRVVCVIEPRKQGGSILTARHAVRQGKPVFVEPENALPASLRPHTRSLRELPETLAALKSGTFSPCPPPSCQPDLF